MGASLVAVGASAGFPKKTLLFYGYEYDRAGERLALLTSTKTRHGIFFFRVFAELERVLNRVYSRELWENSSAPLLNSVLFYVLKQSQNSRESRDQATQISGPLLFMLTMYSTWFVATLELFEFFITPFFRTTKFVEQKPQRQGWGILLQDWPKSLQAQKWVLQEIDKQFYRILKQFYRIFKQFYRILKQFYKILK